MTIDVSRRSLLLGGTAIGLTGVAVAPPAHAATAASLDRALNAYLDTRVGRVGVSVHDLRTGGGRYVYNPWVNETLSTVKVLLAMTICGSAQRRGTMPTAYQQQMMSRMIRYSDNDATNRMMAAFGAPGVQAMARRCGMSSTVVQGGTVAGAASWWGYSTSTPVDMVKMMDGLLTGSHILQWTYRKYILDLMSTVTSAQRWGVASTALPSGLTALQIKTGWGPRTGGYRLNSVGRVLGGGRNYAAAIYSRSPNGFSYGQTTVNRVGRIIYDQLGTLLV